VRLLTGTPDAGKDLRAATIARQPAHDKISVRSGMIAARGGPWRRLRIGSAGRRRFMPQVMDAQRRESSRDSAATLAVSLTYPSRHA